MSDIKRSCPACDSWTSGVGIAFRDGDPCPYCGLPAEVAHLLDKAEAKGVERKVIERLAAAEVRAVKAEAEADGLRGRVRRAAEILDIKSLDGDD